MSIRLLSLFSVLIVAGAATDATALGLKAQANVNAGLATISVEDVPQDFTIGFGRGIGVALLLDAGLLSAGPFFNYSVGGPHTDSDSDNEPDLSLSSASFGLLLKVDLGLAVAQISGGYTTGEATLERESFSFSYDVSGFVVGVAGGYSIPIAPMFALEFGPYFEFRQMEFKEEFGFVERSVNSTALQFGLTLQAVFDLPI